jgi:hypothetical protein
MPKKKVANHISNRKTRAHEKVGNEAETAPSTISPLQAEIAKINMQTEQLMAELEGRPELPMILTENSKTSKKARELAAALKEAEAALIERKS